MLRDHRTLTLGIISSLICYAGIGFLLALGMVQQFDHFLYEKRINLLKQEVQSDIVIIEIDTKSLQAFPDWPWSRHLYGDLVQKLDSAGALAIAFDIDFSAPGTGNERFSWAIKSATMPVYLAVQQQVLSPDTPDFIVELMPHPELQAHAQFMSVNYPVDEDGTVRRSLDGMMFSFGMVPTPGHALAGAPASGKHYGLNFTIDPRSFKRVSIADVFTEQVDLRAFQDKIILVGASAPELGDEFTLPSYGIQSGVVINAIAHETVLRDAQLREVEQFWVLFLALCLWLILSVMGWNYSLPTYLIAQLSATILIISAPLAIMQSHFLILETASLHFVQIFSLCSIVIKELDDRAKKSFYARMNAQDQHTLLKTLVTDNHEGFIVVNRFGEVEIFNQRAVEMLGIQGPIEQGTNLSEINPLLAERFQQGEGKTGVFCQFEYLPDHCAIDVTMSRAVVPLAASRFERRTIERIFVVIALHDISAQKDAEFAERKAKETHEKLSDAKSQLINTMNHELRTPLNHIIGFSDLLKSTAPEDLMEHVEFINQSGNNLLDILNDMLNAAQIQAGDKKLTLSEVNAGEIVDSAISMVQEKKNWKNQQVINIIDPSAEPISADLGYLRQAIIHLLDNAAKFAGPDGIIEVHVEHSEGCDEIIVKDNGPGCPSDLLDQLTIMFFQVDGSSTREFEGCGLGLYLADQIVKLHGGELILRSSPGRGFEARIVLQKILQGNQVPAA